MHERVKNKLLKIKKKILVALPVILFFLFLFYTIIFFFNIRFAIIISAITLLFKTNIRKQHTIKSLSYLIITQFILMYLAFFATLNIPLCILLNLTVPFILVFIQASHFNQLGYFASCMIFVFLQLRPISWNGLLYQTGVMAYAMTVFVLAITLYNLKKKPQDYKTAKKGLILLANALRTKMEQKEDSTVTSEIFQIQQGLYKEAYQSKGITYLVNGAGKIKYMFALLFERAVFFLNHSHQNDGDLNKTTYDFLKELADYIEEAGTQNFTQDSLFNKGQLLLNHADKNEGEVYVFAQNFLFQFLLILENLKNVKEKKPQYDWQLPEFRKPLRKIFYQMRLDSFEMRFALRLSIVLTIGFLYNILIPAEHGYWLVLNAFILLRPTYEDSVYRMKTRFIGTVLGCIIINFLLIGAHNTESHFIIASLMVIGMYTEVPGTWIHTVFVTCYSLMLTTLAIPQTIALGLRLLYVVVAVFLVLIVNKFFLPTNMKNQFQYNIRLLFHYQNLYLRMLVDSLDKPIGYGYIYDTQVHFHLVYDQINQYLKNIDDINEKEQYKKLLSASWFMISEAEQILFLINNKKVDIKDKQQLEQLLIDTVHALNKIQHMMQVIPYNRSHQNEISVVNYEDTLAETQSLVQLMDHYTKHVSEVYNVVLMCKI